jgi:methionyl-tRNA formyltransferase
LKSPEVADHLAQLNPDLVIIIAYRILPRKLISVPRLGCFNLHASLLPAYRGAAPIQHALFNGETETGVTVIKITPRVDAGDMLMQEKIAIGPDEDAGSLHDRFFELSAELLGRTLELVENNELTLSKQDISMVTKAPKITREDMFIQWHKPAEWIHNRIRGLSPRPGALGWYNNRNVKIYKSKLSTYTVSLAPGEIGGTSKDEGLLVGTGTTPVFLEIVQPENKKRMNGMDFARGYKVDTGMFFEDGK